MTLRCIIGNYIMINQKSSINDLPIEQVMNGEYATLEEYVKISVTENLQDVKPLANLIAPIVLRIEIDIFNYNVGPKPKVLIKIVEIIGKTSFCTILCFNPKP